MDFSTDHSFFKAPLYYWYAHESRPNPNRRIKKRKLDESDDDGDDGDDGDDDGDDNSSEGQRVTREDEGNPEGHDHLDEPFEPVTNHNLSVSVNEVIDATSSLSMGDGDPELLPTRPMNPRLVTRDHRLQRNIETLTKHNLFLPLQKPPALRTRHEAILNTILHRSILTRDWDRAKRAFGLLIRGPRVDLRKIWLIGSDLLMRSEATREQSPFRDEYSLQHHNEARKKAEIQNIEYLRRLILQFPFLGLRLGQALPKGSDADFTTFAAERAETTQTKRQKIKDMGKMHYTSALTFWPMLIAGLLGASECPGGGAESSSNNPSKEKGSRCDDFEQRDEYNLSQDLYSPTHAQKIKEHVEEIMITPPWSDDVRLWCMRGMICLWLADIEAMSGKEDEWGDQDDDDGYETPNSLISEFEEEEERRGRKRRQRQLRKPKRDKLLKEAKEAFDKVDARGGSLPEVLGHAMRGLTDMDEDD